MLKQLRSLKSAVKQSKSLSVLKFFTLNENFVLMTGQYFVLLTGQYFVLLTGQYFFKQKVHCFK